MFNHSGSMLRRLRLGRYLPNSTKADRARRAKKVDVPTNAVDTLQPGVRYRVDSDWEWLREVRPNG